MYSVSGPVSPYTPEEEKVSKQKKRMEIVDRAKTLLTISRLVIIIIIMSIMIMIIIILIIIIIIMLCLDKPLPWRWEMMKTRMPGCQKQLLHPLGN